MNLAILIGNLGKDPEVKTFDWGTVATVTLATTRTYKDKQGEKQKLTQWHNLEFRGKLAEVVEKWLKKGQKIQVSGEIQYQEYEKDGVKKYITKISCNEMEMLSGSEGSKPAETTRNEDAPASTFKGDLKPEAPEDDLPF